MGGPSNRKIRPLQISCNILHHDLQHLRQFTPLAPLTLPSTTIYTTYTTMYNNLLVRLPETQNGPKVEVDSTPLPANVGTNCGDPTKWHFSCWDCLPLWGCRNWPAIVGISEVFFADYCWGVEMKYFMGGRHYWSLTRICKKTSDILHFHLWPPCSRTIQYLRCLHHLHHESGENGASDESGVRDH